MCKRYKRKAGYFTLDKQATPVHTRIRQGHIHIHLITNEALILTAINKRLLIIFNTLSPTTIINQLLHIDKNLINTL